MRASWKKAFFFYRKCKRRFNATAKRFNEKHPERLIDHAFVSQLIKKFKLTLTRRRHDMGNSLGDETSCESSTPVTYSTLNVLAPNGQ